MTLPQLIQLSSLGSGVIQDTTGAVVPGPDDAGGPGFVTIYAT